MFELSQDSLRGKCTTTIIRDTIHTPTQEKVPMNESDKQYFLTEEEERKVPSLQEINRRIAEIRKTVPPFQGIDWESSGLFSDEEFSIGVKILSGLEKDERPEFWDRFRRPENASLFSRAVQHIRNGDF